MFGRWGQDNWSCTRVEDEAAGYVLGSLSRSDQQACERHLTRCCAPHPEIAQMADAATALAYLVPMVEPPAALRTRVLAAITQERARDREIARTLPVRRRLALSLAASLAVLVLVLGQTVTWQQQIESLSADQMIIAAALTEGAEMRPLTGNTGRATLLTTDDGGVLVALLPPAPHGHIYEIWLIGPGGPMPAGMLHAGSGVIALGFDPTAVSAVALTAEPGLQAKPTNPVLLSLEL